MEVRVEPFMLAIGDLGPSLQQVANRVIAAAVTSDAPISAAGIQHPTIGSVLQAQLTDNNLHMKITREPMIQTEPIDLKLQTQPTGLITPPKLDNNANLAHKEPIIRDTRPIDPEDLQKNFLPLDLTPPKAAPAFTDSSDLKESSPPRYMCRHCAKQFDSPTDMRLHIENHLKGKAPHCCSVCGKEYRTPSKLQRHVRVHSGERPYSCEVCARRFTRSDHVKQHMKVHLPQKEMNICRICGQKFMRRASLHLHLQQNHMIGSVFTCHQCGEAFESLEQMQAHKLTHDPILNKMNLEGKIKNEYNLAEGLAKFTTSPFKSESQVASAAVGNIDNVMIKPKPANGFTSEQIMSNPGYAQLNCINIPVNEDNLTQASDKLIAENMATLAAQEVAKSLELHSHYNKEMKRLELQAKQHFEKQIEVEHKRQLNEQAKIAACFTLKAAAEEGIANQPIPDNDNKVHAQEQEEKKEKLDSVEKSATLASEDGTSMFIIPSTVKGALHTEQTVDSDIDSMDETDELIQTTETDKDDYVEMETDDATDKLIIDIDHENIETMNKETADEAPVGLVKKTHKMGPKCKTQAYNNLHDKAESDSQQPTILVGTDQASKRMISLINPKLNELIRAKVEQKYLPQSAQSSLLNQNQILHNPNFPYDNTQIAPNTSQGNQRSNLNYLAIAQQHQNLTSEQIQNYLNKLKSSQSLSGTATAFVSPSTSCMSTNVKTTLPALKMPTRKMLHCEHCLMWFEDNAMWLLHNTLHSADESDPFTCRKCYKKLGNRLEFMAHMVWHLEPNMDI